MTVVARPWLPKEALFDATLEGIASGAAATWSQRWFSETRHVSVRTQASASASLAGAAPCWQTEDRSLMLTLDPQREGALSGWMLGLPVNVTKPRNADRRLFADLAAAAAQDLLALLARAFCATSPIYKTEAQRMGADALRFSFSIAAASQVFDLVVDRSRAIEARRAAIAAPPAKPPPRPRAEGLARQRIRVGALIGRARIGLADLWSLDRGDILVLDRGQRDCLELTIDGEVLPGTQCDLLQDGEMLLLRMAHGIRGGVL